MSQQGSSADRRAAEAVVRHHSQLAETLNAHVAGLLAAADQGDAAQAGHYRLKLTAWLHDELLPHAYAEEVTLYPAAAKRPEGALLVEGMLGEHRAIAEVVAELEAADTATRAAAAARALAVMFGAHLAKENDLVVPLLVAAEDVSLAALLDGMHDLIGAGEEPTRGGCGGACGCGGDAAQSGAAAPVLSVDPRLDVRDIPHAQRHARVLATLEALPVDGALVLIAPHAPRPLLAEIDTRFAGRFGVEWLQSGPEVWQLRLHRAA